MPTTLKLMANRATLDSAKGIRSTQYSLRDGPLGRKTVTVARLADIAPAVKAFGEEVLEKNPGASFEISVDVAAGQRKPAGFDKADKAEAFGQAAFIQDVATQTSAAQAQAAA